MSKKEKSRCDGKHISEWIKAHRQIWGVKEGLRYYYNRDIFSRIIENVSSNGFVVEVGSGPGFFRERLSNVFCIDIEPGIYTDCIADALDLPFATNSIDTIVGIDVLHHFSKPEKFFESAQTCLKPGGKIILVEPWAGVFGRWIYSKFHHEECKRISNPFASAAASSKEPMEGNAMIPRQCLIEGKEYILSLGFSKISSEYFGSLSYLATGGFQAWGLPKFLIKQLLFFEKILPQLVMNIIALRLITVIEK